MCESEFQYDFMVISPLGMIDSITSTTEVACFAARAFIDLNEIRQKYERTYVKLVSWLRNKKPGERNYLKLVYQRDDESLVSIVTIESTDDGKWRKVGNEWIDLFTKVPEAKSEEYGHFWQKIWVSGGSGSAHGVTVLIKGVKRAMPKDAITFLQGGLALLRTEIENEVEAKYKNIIPIKEFIDFMKDNFTPNVDENWALACLSTILIEPIIRNALARLGLETAGEFRKIASRLTKYAKEQGVDIEYARLVGKWEERRTAVHQIHEHYISEETGKEAMEFVKELLEKVNLLRC